MDHKRHDRARMLFEQDELKAREVVTAEFLQHYDAFAEQMQMQTDALVAEEREYKRAILRADRQMQRGVRAEERSRLGLVLLEAEHRLVLWDERRRIRLVVEDLLDKVRDQERRRAAAELKKKREALRKQQEDRCKKEAIRRWAEEQELRTAEEFLRGYQVKRQQERLKQNKTMPSLIHKCKPTAVDDSVTTERNESEFFFPWTKMG